MAGGSQPEPFKLYTVVTDGDVRTENDMKIVSLKH
jgi:hypothetical protein